MNFETPIHEITRASFAFGKRSGFLKYVGANTRPELKEELTEKVFDEFLEDCGRDPNTVFLAHPKVLSQYPWLRSRTKPCTKNLSDLFLEPGMGHGYYTEKNKFAFYSVAYICNLEATHFLGFAFKQEWS